MKSLQQIFIQWICFLFIYICKKEIIFLTLYKLGGFCLFFSHALVFFWVIRKGLRRLIYIYFFFRICVKEKSSTKL
jgi:hypothetical protein